MTGDKKPIAIKPAGGPPASAGDDGIVDLLRQLTEQGSHLAQQQVDLMQAEIKSSIADLKLAIGAVAGAAVVGIAGLGVLLMALAYLLGEVMEMWLAALIVGIGAMVVGYLMYQAGSKKMSAASLAPDATKRTLERAPGAVSATTTGKGQA